MRLGAKFSLVVLSAHCLKTFHNTCFCAPKSETTGYTFPCRDCLYVIH